MVSLITLKKYYDLKGGKDAGFRKGMVFAVYRDKRGKLLHDLSLFTDKKRADEYKRHIKGILECIYQN